MLAAARSDGHVDDNERVRIQGGIRQLGLEEAVLQMIENELDEPVDAAVIASAADSPEAAAEIYLTSLMVIDPDRPDERRYLQELAEHLKLEPGLVQELEARAGDVTAA